MSQSLGFELRYLARRARPTLDSVRIEELINFKGAQYPKSMILYAVYFYVRFLVSYRDLKEIMAERGVDLDHATLNRWVEKYAGAIAEEVHRRKSPTGCSWRMDETHVKVKGKWTGDFIPLAASNVLYFSMLRELKAAGQGSPKGCKRNGWCAA